MIGASGAFVMVKSSSELVYVGKLLDCCCSRKLSFQENPSEQELREMTHVIYMY